MKEINFRGKKIKYSQHPDFWVSVRDVNGWEPEMFDILDRFIRPGKVFLDIGAWNGVCSIYASLLGGVCHAIEPDTVSELLESIYLNEANCTTYRYAITDKNGVVNINNFKGGFGNSMSSVLNRYEMQDTKEVESLTLESFIKKHNIKPDFIKMDVEGAEALILPSSIKILRELNCPLYLSLHPEWLSTQQLVDINEAILQIYSTKVNQIHNQYLLFP